MNALVPFLHRTRIAYFSMEIALRPEIHTYSGGLGVLAGDTARSAADLDLPMVFVTLLSREGYIRQEIGVQENQINKPNPWRPEEWASPLPAMIAVSIEGRSVWVRPWLYLLTCPVGNVVPVLLLDTDLEQNSAEDRQITDRLYGGDDAHRLKQEIVLGIGGSLLLRALGFRIQTYHLNEGHAALLALQLLRETHRPGGLGSPSVYDRPSVRERCVFTTHTPVEAGFDRFDYGLVSRLLGDFFDLAELKTLAGEDRLNMTRLALNLSGYVNGVARRHAETASGLFPGYQIRSITNGVHVQTWVHSELARRLEARFPQWAHEPEVIALADQIPDDEIWAAHQAAKVQLLGTIRERTGTELQLDLPLIGFARRMTSYKRPNLLFTDLARLKQIARDRPFQVVLAGLAHPLDDPGKQIIEELHRHIRALQDAIPIVFLPEYDMTLARMLVSGADIWLNTPLPPLEASGTSGMKAALNGVLNLSVMDGWWVEACVEGVTGWGIQGTPPGAGDAEALYRKLEDVVLPLYQDRARWIWMMKQSISKIGPTFNSHRMMRRYATEAYMR
ncbi:alpha-glucan family phosphorylase [Devosia sp.]|uniref:alpha-glucan family phosphorylase n=1 Tax=Devosia sp. TaxID=1871048 RepID=UPI0025B8D598|nr:alpha-glucan family phosphorylase [Devosia sp.]